MDAHSGANAEREDHERLVVLGRILGAFGVAGWVKVESYTEPTEGLLNYSRWLLDQRSRGGNMQREVRLLQGRKSNAVLHAQLEAVTTREEAAELGGALINVRRRELPKLDRNEYYWDDLIGLEAWSPDGEYLGEIAEIRTTPAHPLLHLVETRAPDRSIERWVPLVRERVRHVDLETRRAVLDWHRDW